MKEQALKALVVMAAIFAPIKTVLLTTAVLIVVDLITGVIAAKKRGESITSAGLRRTISKGIIYELAIILGFITQNWLTGETVPVQNIVTSFIGLTEFLSVVENLNDIGGGSLLKSLIDKLNSQNAKS